MDTHEVQFSIRNPGEVDRQVCVEPFGCEFVIPEGESLEFVLTREDAAPVFHVEEQEDCIQIWLEDYHMSELYVLENEIRIPCLQFGVKPVPAAEKRLRRIQDLFMWVMTVGFFLPLIWVYQPEMPWAYVIPLMFGLVLVGSLGFKVLEGVIDRRRRRSDSS